MCVCFPLVLSSQLAQLFFIHSRFVSLNPLTPTLSLPYFPNSPLYLNLCFFCCIDRSNLCCILISTCKWYHTVFVFVFLASCKTSGFLYHRIISIFSVIPIWSNRWISLYMKIEFSIYHIENISAYIHIWKLNFSVSCMKINFIFI